MKYSGLILTLLSVQLVFAQTKLPIIKATSPRVSINDGGYLDKNAWSLSPKARPDVFTADRSRKTKWVTFYTDIDSIRVKVKPGSKFNFVVILNGKDSCFTQIVSAIPPESKVKKGIATHDTIPFTLTGHNTIAVKAIMNNTDTLNLHFDLSSFDFHFTRDAILHKTKLLNNPAKPSYNNLNKLARLQMGSMVWVNTDILPTNITADGMDGRFGWNLFEGRQVEVNYDSNLLIIHSALPAGLKGYAKSKMEFGRSYPFVKCTFIIAGKKCTGIFSMDTGAESAMILDSAFAARNGFNNLKVIKVNTLSDPRGVKFETKTVLTPQFKINGFELDNVPALLLSGKNREGFELNYLGNGLLKRFNMVLDFKNDYLYLKPNKLINFKYKENS